LKDILKGEAKLVFTNEDRWIEGTFGENGVPITGFLKGIIA
jgi:hypothetical protein